MCPQELTVRQRHLLKSKDIKQLNQELLKLYPADIVDALLPSKAKIEWIKIENNEELYAVDGILALWHTADRYIPILSFLLRTPLSFKAVKVDKGAIPYVSNGADVMRPGIMFIDPTILQNDVIMIQDPVHGRVLAVGIALFDGKTMQAMDKGKVIKTVHALNDNIWNFSKSFK